MDGLIWTAYEHNMGSKTPAKIRKEILKQRGVQMEKHTRKPVPVTDIPTPFKKTTLMKLLESQQGLPIEQFIFIGTIYEAEKNLGIDATTISKWRTLITDARDKEFFAQFEEG